MVEHPFQRASEDWKREIIAKQLSIQTRAGTEKKLFQCPSCSTRGSLKSEADLWGHVAPQLSLEMQSCPVKQLILCAVNGNVA